MADNTAAKGFVMRQALELALEALRKAMQGNLGFDEAMEAFKSLEKSLAQLDQDEVDIRSRLYQRIHELETQLAQPEQEPVISDAFVFENLNGIYGDPKHHKIPLTRCQIVEFGRKMFELGAKSSTSPKVEQEPVAWAEQQFYADGTPNPCALLKWAGRKAEDDFPIGTKFYTTPPQRKLLTDEKIKAIHFEWMTSTCGADTLVGFARAIEAAHGIKE